MYLNINIENYLLFNILTALIVILCKDTCYARKLTNKEALKLCSKIPESTLRVLLGPSYNSRYMSVVKPGTDYNYKKIEDIFGIKRKTSEFPSFYVNDEYTSEISEKAAWEVDYIPRIRYQNKPIDIKRRSIADSRRRFLDSIKRSDKTNRSRPWDCEPRIKWIDIGPNYFPRYLRTVECIRKNCWYGHHICKPRSFTVQILKKRKNECTTITEYLRKITPDQELSNIRSELWVWEERAVNFCCDCVATK